MALVSIPGQFSSTVSGAALDVTPFWGDTRSGSASIVPADNPPDQVSEPIWEAPLEQWSDWDLAYIAGLRVPGRVVVRAKKGNRVHAKKSAGSHGATPSMLGFDPGEVTFQFDMWTREHMKQYVALVGLFKTTLLSAMAGKSTDTTSSKKVLAYDVKHTVLNLHDIFSLYFVEWASFAEPGTPHGVMRAVLRMSEFSPIPPNTAVRTVKAAYDNNYAGVPQVQFNVSKTPPPHEVKAVTNP